MNERRVMAEVMGAGVVSEEGVVLRWWNVPASAHSDALGGARAGYVSETDTLSSRSWARPVGDSSSNRHILARALTGTT